MADRPWLCPGAAWVQFGHQLFPSTTQEPPHLRALSQDREGSDTGTSDSAQECHKDTGLILMRDWGVWGPGEAGAGHDTLWLWDKQVRGRAAGRPWCQPQSLDLITPL